MECKSEEPPVTETLALGLSPPPQLFDRLRKERPGFASQLKPVFGDMLLPGLGITDSDRQMLERSVHVVFHSAATIRFDEPLRVAVEMNVVAVRKMLALCRGFHHLEVSLALGTACRLGLIVVVIEFGGLGELVRSSLR